HRVPKSRPPDFYGNSTPLTLVLEAGARYGMHVVNLRLAMVYGRGGRGNLERMARGIRAGWFPPLPETGNRRSLVHVDDVVSVMRLVAEAPAANGRTYIVADPRAYSGREIYDAIRAASAASAASAAGAVPHAGHSIPAAGHFVSPVPKRGFPSVTPTFRWSVPAGVLRAAGRLNGRLGEIVGRLIGSACYSPARIERELGWRAKVGLEAGLREMLSINTNHSL
ncbi:MAG: NAD-dependent epimerase/dehydratase family protein, partial [Rhodocyclaceae bacterium]|nr:NAD-dependent epimerase/dehydratase family protein [Rhodocyclaceae bacterium]